MSIQQRISSEVYKLADNAITPEQIKAVQAHVVKGVQDGSVPSYVGIPLLNDLNQKMGSIQNAGAQAQAMMQQPPIAQQVMGQAEQGLETLPSHLPAHGMAGGGIVAFADGGLSSGDMAAYLLADEDDEDDDYVRAMLGDIGNKEAAKAQEEEEEGVDGMAAMPAFRSSMSEARSGEKKTTGLQSLLDLIEKKESGGRDYDKYGNLLTSSAGAQGRMQVMPATARDPGFGIRPAKEGDTEDLARVGKELYGKLLDKYHDPKLAAAAYNWGSGNVDKWLMAGADESKMPAETRNYIKGFAQGGIASFAGGGLDYIPPVDDLEKQKALLERMRRIEQAKAAYSGVPAAEAAPAAAATEGGLGGLWNAAKSAVGRINPAGAVGWSSALYSPDLNTGEDERLKRIWAKQAAQQQAAPTSTAGAGRGAQGGPNLQQSKQAAFEQAVGNTQDTEDMEAGLNALPDTSSTKTAEAAAPKKGGIDAMLDQYSQDLKGQRETNAYLALLSAGLGMMGGTSPYAMTNVGQGAQQGINTYAGLNQATGADERALLGARINAEKYKSLNDIRQAQIAAQQEAKGNQTALGQQRLALQQQKAYSDQLNEIRRMAQNKMIAEYKGALLPEQKEQIMAQAEQQLMQDPAYAALYEKVYGFKPQGSGGGKTINFGDLGKK